MGGINKQQEEIIMKMLMGGVFGLVLSMFGISVISTPLEAFILIILFCLGLHYDEIITSFKGEK